jgi:hypothetical protein
LCCKITCRDPPQRVIEEFLQEDIITTLEELEAPEEYLENENYIKPIEDLDQVIDIYSKYIDIYSKCILGKFILGKSTISVISTCHVLPVYSAILAIYIYI